MSDTTPVTFPRETAERLSLLLEAVIGFGGTEAAWLSVRRKLQREALLLRTDIGDKVRRPPPVSETVWKFVEAPPTADDDEVRP